MVGVRKIATLLIPLVFWASYFAVAAPDGTGHVKTPADLQQHYRLHIFRTMRLGVALYRRNPEEFPELSTELVRDFLNLHDRAKLDSSPGFREQFWPTSGDGASLLDRLYGIYGSGYNPPDPGLLSKIESTKRLLNAADHNVAREFFRRNGMVLPDGSLDHRARALLRLEHIADVVDRSSDPVAREEFRIDAGKEPALSVFLTQGDVLLAEWLRARYREITQGLEYATSITRAMCRYFRLAPPKLPLSPF